MFITPAYAQTAAESTQAQLLQFLPIVLCILVAYFMLIRPQQAKAKQLKTAQAGLRRGDRIITAGGIYGTIHRVVTDDEVEVAIAENVRIRVVRSTITTILSKPEPSTGSSAPDKSGKPRVVVRGKKPEETNAPKTIEGEVVETKEETVSTPPASGQGGGTAG